MSLRIENDAPGFANSEKKAWEKGLIASGPFSGSPGTNNTASDE
jgi:hypothetical protein